MRLSLCYYDSKKSFEIYTQRIKHIIDHFLATLLGKISPVTFTKCIKNKKLIT